MNDAAKDAWKCKSCGKPLPTRGLVWSARYRAFVAHYVTNPICTYECDVCIARPSKPPDTIE